MIILKNTTEPQDVMIQRPNPDNEVKRSEYLKSSDLKTLNDESLVGQGNISIPVVTKTSDLINDSGFIDSTALTPYALKTDIPTKTSQLTNDSDYTTKSYVDSSISTALGTIETKLSTI